MTNPPRGMILLSKPEGRTSFHSLGACKRAFATRRVGHAGTLDKFATGLLLAFVNEATRLVPYFVGMDKRYEAVVAFGEQTDTLDPEGTVVDRAPAPGLAAIEAVLPRFVGRISQTPPAYSAIHVGGKRAYQRALSGEAVAMPSREVEIAGIEIVEWRSPLLTLRVDCGSGTYIRALARDIALACGSVASLRGLSRLSVGPFRLEDAVAAPDDPTGTDWAGGAWIEGAALARAIPGVRLLEAKPAAAAHFRNGKRLDRDWFVAGGDGRDGEAAVCCGDDFLGIVESRGGEWSYRLVFPGAGAGPGQS